MKKRLLSVILSLIISVSGCLCIFASAEDNTSSAYDGTPVIMIRGMDFEGLYVDEGTENERNCFKGIDAGQLIGTIFKALFKGIFTNSTEKGVQVLADYFNDVMGAMACNPDGSSKYNVGVHEYPLSLANYPDFVKSLGGNNEVGFMKTAVEKYGAENVYYFNYDWRIDPYINAERLDKLIDRAISDSGKDKVNLVCCSMGGIEATSYIYKYGYSKLNKVLFVSSTFCGTHVTSDLLQGKVVINADNLYNYANQMFGQSNKALSVLLNVLYKTKILNGLVNGVNKLVPKLIDPVYKLFLRDTYGSMPTVWALVLPEDYDNAVKYMFGGEEDKYAGIIELSKQYQEMQAKRNEMLLQAQEDGVYIAVIAGYDRAVTPLYTGGGGTGDNILEADRMLGGATIAPLGTTLGEDYTGERVSPDNIVDLSGVIFPETTWALKGCPHVPLNSGSDCSEFIFTILEYDGRFTVDTDARYPQFIKSSSAMNLEKF